MKRGEGWVAVVTVVCVGICLALALACGGGGGGGNGSGNTSPVINQFTANPSDQVSLDQAVTFTIVAQDADGDALSYSWSCTGGILSSTTGNVTTWKIIEAPSQETIYVVQIVVTDGKGGSASGAVNLTASVSGETAVGELSVDSEAPDVSGYWKMYFTEEGESEEGPRLWYFTQSGSDIVGDIGWDATCTGSVADSSISLVCQQDSELLATMSGTVTGNTMSGTFTGDQETGTWRADKTTDEAVIEATLDYWPESTDKWWLSFHVCTPSATRVYATSEYIDGEYDLYKCTWTVGDYDHWWSSNNPECTEGDNNYNIGEEPNLPFDVTIHIVTTGELTYTETISSYKTNP